MSTHHGAEARATRSLLALGAAYTLLVIASVAALLLRRSEIGLSDIAGLNPFGPPEIARRFFAEAPEATRVAAFFGFTSAIPLAIYTATVVARLQGLGVRHA